ncbi:MULTISPECIES: GIY-YIG nuclease family protein [unclassified Streptomyces]|uniref:GIY-YIG nuclease family protein n=1 Tax=unclassified Streptomyces TaxID=2593676 RepID=UPI000BF116BF|nr:MULTISPECIES: GIY-YIG nuclease family protein [unclassified Streptomyces]
MTDSAQRPTALYRLFDEEGVLLYVGIAVDPEVRLRVHAREKTWWPQVAQRSIEWFANRAEAEAAEMQAIVSEGPSRNVEHSTTRQRGDAKAEYRSPYPKPRQVRIPTDMWTQFGRAAKLGGTSRAKVVSQLIDWYIGEPGVTPPVRPPLAQGSSS